MDGEEVVAIIMIVIVVVFIIGLVFCSTDEYPCTIIDKYEYQGRHAFLYAVQVGKREIENQEQQVGKQEWETTSVGATQKCKLNANPTNTGSARVAAGVAAGYLMSSGARKR